MTAATSRAYAHQTHRPLDIHHVAKSAFGFGFLAVVVYEAAVPLGLYATTDFNGYVAAGVGLVVGSLFALWK